MIRKMINRHGRFPKQGQSRRNQQSLAATRLLACLALSLGYSPTAQAADCDSPTNTILSPDNVACGSANTVGGTIGSTAPSSLNSAFGMNNFAESGGSTAIGAQNLASGANSLAVGYNNEALGRASQAVGMYNSVGAHPTNADDGALSSAFGWDNLIRTTGDTATGSVGFSTAIGSVNLIYATTSTAIGFANKVGDKFIAGDGLYFDASTAIGYNSKVYGSNSVVIGASAEAGVSDLVSGTPPYANQAVAIGSQAKARVDGTIAIGDKALAGLSDLAGSGGITYASTNSIAIGTNAKVYGTATTTGLNGIAMGASAQTTGDNSASLGAGSSDGGQSNVVAVGNSSSQRRIINLAAGVDPTDGVNVSQLKSMETSLTNQMNSIGDKAYAGTATVAAIAGIPALPEGKNFNIGAGFGNYLGQSGVAIGGNVRLTNKMALKAAVGYANSNATTSVGLGFAF